MNLQDELELIQQAKDDIGAFRGLYQIYYPKIFAYVYNRVPTPDEAKDITAQVFLASIENIKNFDIERGLRLGSLLYKIANNKIYDFYKKNERKAYNINESNHAENIDYTKDIAKLEKRTRTQNVLSQLKPRYQQIINLKFYTDLSNSEIAESLGIEVSHVAVVLHRALKSFKKKYMKLYPESEIYNV
ncbi:sigma-70 family RNA polymerase sigma factor [Candidatus Dojkabacteria bacterium]|uniref:Sigma-70 family RNA polymerase sigma factor n=1 Tax=Candidatus Dojkabacteria bacterium TaxID=2099670 RepID=A0A955L5C9_9BACT|nr:sigma-70 family RNA polymerase sigma factor [Candidatus Dojkabacteria bacterium]